MGSNIREIPYNYTSFSDKEIISKFLNEDIWNLLNKLRSQRRTGRSARILFSILGDMWVIKRNPYIQDDLLANKKRRLAFYQAHNHKLEQIRDRAAGNADALTLIEHAQTTIIEFKSWLEAQPLLQKKILKKLSKHTHENNILFDGMSRVSHVTDASDWRVEYPVVVLTPETENEIIKLVRECIKLDLNIIPRGGGTGYTGGAIPMTDNAVVINTEKLDFIKPVNQEILDGLESKTNTIETGAGTITVEVSKQAAEHNLIFAVDPTSQDSSTIGGNVATNAGGKKAVMWGTTLDNLASWKIVMPDGFLYNIKRLGHNLGKIHNIDKSEFSIEKLDDKGKTIGSRQTINLLAADVRKPGLGKDVTNKLLGKLPGVQKEGCDGIITSAKFILHNKPKHTHTICLEFFDPDLHQSVPVIVEIVKLLEATTNVDLTGLEHLDKRYIKAVGYSTKSSRSELPNMLLLADIASDNEAKLITVANKITALIKNKDAKEFIATTYDARESFWADRKRTAAIAAHTNAFKINEDVVIPLNKLAEYADEIEYINIQQSIINKLEIVEAYRQIITDTAQETTDDDELQEIRNHKFELALGKLDAISKKWQSLLDNLDNAISDQTQLELVDVSAEPSESVFKQIQKNNLLVSLRKSVQSFIDDIFNGNEWQDLRKKLGKAHSKIRNRRIFVATHMHAGDGNVHTNIPVHSNDYEMLKKADEIVDHIMQTAEKLGGAISGEHGIGLTKIKYLAPENIEDFKRYKLQIDKADNFNRGKLSLATGLDNAYTPSLRLLELEAILLEASELGQLNNAIKDCLRCGKCKPVCSTHVPRANLLYSPRNKILASSLLIEAFLYEEQTKRGVSMSHFTELNDIADHCTVCHRCLKPCPVNIDYGDVTVHIRNILKKHGKRKFNLGSYVSMLFLNITDARLINILRALMIRFGYSIQRKISKLAGTKQTMPHTTGQSSLNQQVVSFIKTPMPKDLPTKSLRAMLNLEDKTHIPLIRNPKTCDENTETVFYFPGCGSERLFSQIGLGVLKWLHHINVQTIMPPGYLCCGYPQIASGDYAKGNKIITDNRVLFHRMAQTLSFLNISKIIVSCGTCLDQLEQYELDILFPNANLLDIHEYLYEKGISVATEDKNYLLHDPCHSPDKKHEPLNMTSKLLKSKISLADRCCGESGTFAVARADISTQVKFRKLEELKKDKNNFNSQADKKILTTCPSCLQGLARAETQTRLKADYVILEMADNKFGKNWQDEFIRKINKNSAENILI